jgi:AP-3 complex subunit delta
LGLLGLNNVLTEYPKYIVDLKDTILECLDDDDITIRYRAIDLICGVVNKNNIKAIIQKLMKKAKNGEGKYKNFIIEKVIETCSKDNYEHIGSFKWYISILVALAKMDDNQQGSLIAYQLLNTHIRVKAIRAYGIVEMVNSHFLKAKFNFLNTDEVLECSNNSISDVVYAGIWILGEFVQDLPEELSKPDILKCLLNPNFLKFNGKVQSVCVQTILKIFTATAIVSDKETLETTRDLIRKDFDGFLKSGEIEVQERVKFNTKIKGFNLHKVDTIT